MNYLELEPNDMINTADLIPIGATVYANLPSIANGIQYQEWED